MEPMVADGGAVEHSAAQRERPPKHRVAVLALLAGGVTGQQGEMATGTECRHSA